MIPPELVGATTVTRSHRLTFFIDEGNWRELRSKDLRVIRLLTHVGRSSFKQYAVVTLYGTPVFSLTTTVVAVNSTLQRSIPLPLGDVMRAAMTSQLPRAARVRDLPWSQTAAPGGGSEHARDLILPARPENAFCWQAVARWVECDEYGHMSQSQYALLMEEARASAASAGAYSGLGCAVAHLPPVRFDIDFIGQAFPGNKLSIFTWWDGESFCCEMERQRTESDVCELLIRSRVWVTQEAAASKM